MQIKKTTMATHHRGQSDHQKQNKQQVLMRLWRKGNPRALLLGMHTGTATVENSMEFPQKIKMKLHFDPAIPVLGLYRKNPETPIQKNLCTPMFIAALFTIAKFWKQPKCPLVNEWIKNVQLHNGILQGRKKEGIPILCNSVERTGVHHAK